MRWRRATFGGPELLGDARKLVEQIVGRRGEHARGPDAAPRPRCLPLPVVALVLPAEDAALQRRPRCHAEPQLAGHRDELPLDGALQERILDLERDERRRTSRNVANICASVHFQAGVSEEAEVADLPVAHEVVERAHRLFDRRRRVPGVHPVEVDVARLQSTERLLALRDDGLPAGAAAVRIARIEVAQEFGRQDEAIALCSACRPRWSPMIFSECPLV